MTNNAAKRFWKAYLTMASKDGSHLSMLNPADDFSVRTKIGEFDSLSDGEFGSRKADAEAISSFWNHKHSEMIGMILLNALASTNISDVEIDDIAGILADASARMDYCTEEQEETQECDEGLLNPDSDFSPVEEPTPFDRGWTPRVIYNYLYRDVQ